MQISRTDVVTSHILETQDPRRFLKVPIKGYLDLLGITPITSQVALINAINNPKYRFISAALSRRQGKTYIANIIGQVVALVPGSNVLIMSPNYSLSQISFELQRGLIKHFDLEVTKDNAKDKVITMSNGSNIRMGSVKQVDSCVGRSYDLIIFDEAALTSEGLAAFNVALRPTLDKPNSKAIFISTPRGKNNWFSQFWDRGFSNDFPEWFSIKATWKDNPRISISDIDEARKTMSDQEFTQEYECNFNIFEGQIWNFKASECVKDLSNLNLSNCDIIAGLDVGFRDDTALVVIAYCWTTEMYYVIAEYQLPEKTTEQHAKNIKPILDKYDVDWVYIDSAAQQTKFDFAQMYDISCTNAKKSKLDGIGFVGSIVDNNRLIVDIDCVQTISALDQYQWDQREGLTKEKEVRNGARHLADSIRYALYSYRTSSLTV